MNDIQTPPPDPTQVPPAPDPAQTPPGPTQVPDPTQVPPAPDPTQVPPEGVPSQTPPPAPDPTQVPPPAPDPTQVPAVSYDTWPTKGDDRPQPWKGGALVIEHRYPLLGPGTADVIAVTKLCEFLGLLGYETSMSLGRNPFGIVDPSVLAAVQQFRNDYNVEEDPTAFGGENDHTRQLARNHVGAWTWEALLRAAEHVLEERV